MRIARVAGVPVASKGDQHPVLEGPPHLGVLRDIELDESLAELDVGGAPETLGDHADEIGSAFGCVVRKSVDEDIIDRTFEDRRCLFERRTPCPFLDGSRIAGRCQ